MNKKLLLVNIAVFFGILASIEGGLLVTKYYKDIFDNYSIEKKEKKRQTEIIKKKQRGEIKEGEIIETKWKHVFHPGVGHSHQIKEFERNINTSGLDYDNISVIEVFEKNNNSASQVKILTLGGSTTDPLGTGFSGYRGTWVHHLFNKISQINSSRYVVDNAGNAGSNSSNELLRLITKLHENDYDLVLSFNGINELYFATNPYLKDNENVLASSMLLSAMNEARIIKGLGNKTYTITSNGLLPTFIKKTRTYMFLGSLKRKIRENPEKLNLDSEEILTSHEKEMLVYGANVWEKNIDFMHSVSTARNSRYLEILQPTLGLDKDYCKNENKECMLSNPKYVARINFIYSLMRDRCQKRTFCLDISNDRELNSDESLYTNARHPNSKGNRRIADLIMERVLKTLND